MWWKMSEDFFNGAFVEVLELRASRTSPKVGSYILEIIKKITQSLSHDIPAPKKPSIAWEVMLEQGIMRQTKSGNYSAVDWLKENKLFGEKVEKKQGAKLDEEATNKVHVRQNVTLTGKELLALNESYKPRVLETAYDLLNEYKETKSKKYASDYWALKKWALGAAIKARKERAEDPTHTELKQVCSGRDQPRNVDNAPFFECETMEQPNENPRVNKALADKWQALLNKLDEPKD